MSALTDDLSVRIAEVHSRIDAAARRAGRDPADVQLVAVSKTYGADAIRAAYEAGLRHFGENRVEEAEPKIARLREALPDITWHMIGHIQSRKTAEVAGVFDWVHSVERFKIARRLSEAAQQGGRVLPILLEVNISGEASKDGFDLADLPASAAPFEAFCAEVEQMATLPGLMIEGLMTMAPFTEAPETARPVFQRLRALRDGLRERFPALGWRHLSMGMTADFEVAVEEGATLVRIGTAIFGPRAGNP